MARSIVCLTVWLLAAAPALAADVTTRTITRDYFIAGTTPVAIVDYFHSHPFSGDSGPALANIRPAYQLNLTTRGGKGGCGVASINLDIAYTITLPKARDEAAMSAGTRAMWRSLARFAKAHELGHRQMYTACARRFVTRAKAIRAPSCAAVASAVRQLQRQSEAACEASQVNYDILEAWRAGKLAIFRAAREARR